MGGALIKGWIAARTFSAIHVVEPLPSEAIAALARDSAIALHAVFDAGTLPPLDAAVLAIKPQVLKGETALLQALGKTGALVLSIAAGITTGSVERRAWTGCAAGARHAQHAGRHRARHHRALRGRSAGCVRPRFGRSADGLIWAKRCGSTTKR